MKAVSDSHNPRTMDRPSPGIRRRLLLGWTLLMWTAWLGSRDTGLLPDLPSVLFRLFMPPWPFAGAAAISAVKAGAGALLTATACLGSGLAVTGLVRRKNGEDRVVAAAAGIPLTALLLQALGLLGLAYPAILAGAALAPASCGLWNLARFGRSAGWSERPIHGESPALRWIICAAIAVVGLAALAPETAWDAVVYHLRVPSLYMLQHRICPVPEIFPSFFPFSGEMLLMLAGVLGGDPAARLTHFLAWLATAIVIARLAENANAGIGATGTACPVGTSQQISLDANDRLYASSKDGSVGTLAAALFLTIPLGMVIACRAYVEFFLVLPLACSLLVLLSPRFSGRRIRALEEPAFGRRGQLCWPCRPLGSDLVLAGWLAGAVLGTKYQGAPIAILLGVATVSLYHGRLPVAAARFTLPALAACGGWFLRNTLWTGNPVYPLLGGGPRWTPADTAGWYGDASAFRLDPVLLLTAPWTLIRETAGDGGLSPVLFSVAAAPLLWSTGRSRFLWFTALALGFLWWLASPLPRYLLPSLAILCAASAAMAGTPRSEPANQPGPQPWHRRWAVPIGLAVMTVDGVTAIHFGTEPYGAAAGKTSPREYLAHRFRPPDFTESLARLETVVPPHGRAYIIGHNFSYGLSRRSWFDFLYTRPCLYWWLDGVDTPARILVRARQAGLTHLAWYPRGALAILGEKPGLMDWTPRRLALWLAFWKKHVRETERLANWTIFEISGSPAVGTGRWRNQRKASFARPGSRKGLVPGTEGVFYAVWDAAREGDRERAKQLAAGIARDYPSLPELGRTALDIISETANSYSPKPPAQPSAPKAANSYSPKPTAKPPAAKQANSDSPQTTAPPSLSVP
jgi:hypothetical protein